MTHQAGSDWDHLHGVHTGTHFGAFQPYYWISTVHTFFLTLSAQERFLYYSSALFSSAISEFPPLLAFP